MENTKVDLKKLNEQDWEKYRKMRKVASRQKLNAEIVAALVIGIFLVALVVGFIYISASALNHADALANYSNNQTVAVMHNLNTNFNGTGYLHWTNTTLSTLISAMKNNPKALSAFAVNTYTTMQSYFYLSIFLIVLLFALFYTIFFTSITSSGIPRTYKYFRKELNRLAERDENLRVYGYTEQEIAWYHAIRSELIKLELEYQM
jgi:predicted PurR-regulated permease PerM